VSLRAKKEPRDRKISPAAEVKEIADLLIRPSASDKREWPSCAACQERLQSITIVYGRVGTAPRRGGRVEWGKTEKVCEKHKVLGYKFDQNQAAFLVTVGGDVWDKLSKPQKLALVDHELSHIGFNAAGAPCVVPHEITEFRGVVMRHGVDWEAGLKQFAEACFDRVAQLRLDLEPSRRVVEPGVVATNGALERAA